MREEKGCATDFEFGVRIGCLSRKGCAEDSVFGVRHGCAAIKGYTADFQFGVRIDCSATKGCAEDTTNQRGVNGLVIKILTPFSNFYICSIKN